MEALKIPELLQAIDLAEKVILRMPKWTPEEQARRDAGEYVEPSSFFDFELDGSEQDTLVEAMRMFDRNVIEGDDYEAMMWNQADAQDP